MRDNSSLLRDIHQDVNLIFWLTVLGVAVLAVLVLVFGIFAILTWSDREATRSLREDIQKHIAASNLLQNVIKGWTVVHVEEERKKGEEAQKTVAAATAVVQAAAEEIKAAISDHSMKKPVELSHGDGTQRDSSGES